MIPKAHLCTCVRQGTFPKVYVCDREGTLPKMCFILYMVARKRSVWSYGASLQGSVI